MYLALYFSKNIIHWVFLLLLTSFYAFVLTSSSLSSPRIHSRIAKCWLMNDRSIPVLELPGHIVHVMGSARKIIPKNETHPEWCPSCAPALSSPPLQLLIILWEWMLIVVSVIIIWKMTFWVITSNILWCGWDWQKLL